MFVVGYIINHLENVHKCSIIISMIIIIQLHAVWVSPYRPPVGLK
jgi:hypothetical protein